MLNMTFCYSPHQLRTIIWHQVRLRLQSLKRNILFYFFLPILKLFAVQSENNVEICWFCISFAVLWKNWRDLKLSGLQNNESSSAEADGITFGAPMALDWALCSVSRAQQKSCFMMVTPLEHKSSCRLPPLNKQQHFKQCPTKLNKTCDH